MKILVPHDTSREWTRYFMTKPEKPPQEDATTPTLKPEAFEVVEGISRAHGMVVLPTTVDYQDLKSGSVRPPEFPEDAVVVTWDRATREVLVISNTFPAVKPERRYPTLECTF